MKVKLAAFHDQFGNAVYLEANEDGSLWADKSADYVRVTDSADIELPDLERGQIVAARLKTLGAYEEKIKDQFHRAIAGIKDQREKLLALPNHVSEQS